MSVSRLAGAPPVFWTVRQALDDPRSLTRSTRLAVAGARMLSSRAAGIVYNSARAREQHEQYGYAARFGKVIPNGVVVPEQADPTPRKARVFGIAARFHPQKDYLNFFRAAAQMAAQFPDARFVAAGFGLDDRNSEVLAMIEDAGLDPARLKLLGELRDMGDFYSQIDVLVLSSRTEGFPNVVAEAMSHARPVVTTNVGDAALVVAVARLDSLTRQVVAEPVLWRAEVFCGTTCNTLGAFHLEQTPLLLASYILYILRHTKSARGQLPLRSKLLAPPLQSKLQSFPLPRGRKLRTFSGSSQ